MIQSTSNLTGYYRADTISHLPSQKAPSGGIPAQTGDNLSSASTEGLRQALAKTAEIRPEIVARGKALAVDPSYPPRQILEGLAKLMIASSDPSANA